MIKLPIRQLVELIMRNGDIDSRYVAKDRMLEGAKAHRRLQKENQKRYKDYRSEVTLSIGYVHEEMEYLLEGRADGVFVREGQYIIEEIKTTTLPLHGIDEDFNQAHWAQAKCYAYILVIQNDLPEVAIQLTYFNMETEESKSLTKTFQREELALFLAELISQYSQWAEFSAEWEKIRDLSIKTLLFPFPGYRKGQREFAVAAYRTIVGRKRLFVQAPTGTGKTISALFPAIKAMGEGKINKIFYLTAKTITRQVAGEAFAKMRHKGLKMKTLTLTAKEKICFCEKPLCNPELCDYAKGHYDRVNEALFDAIRECDDLSREQVERYARKHLVCPFELSLDLSLWADCVTCDYNYVFDPKAYLRRFFADDKGDYVFLVDEAHNLVDRAREMFSARLCKTEFHQIKKTYQGESKVLNKILNSINRVMLEFRQQCGEAGYILLEEKPERFIGLINQYIGVCELLLKDNQRLREDNAFLQLYFQALSFGAMAEFYDERYVTFIEIQGNDVIVKLFCLDPSYLLGEALNRGAAAVLFSATFSPLTYFREILGGGGGDQALCLDSPFDKEKLCVVTAGHVSTKFKDREKSIAEIIDLIVTLVFGKVGNYIIYFPSYKYMNEVFQVFIQAYPDIKTVKQGNTLTEEEREEFLSSFVENPQESYVAFCVLGGIFSEGVDLKGSRLIGTAIVSVGLPQLSTQQGIIQDYFKHKNGKGFEYAYMYPGMNKVLQAAGRVIRSEKDTGVVLLIDERFRHVSYSRLFPKHWHPYQNITHKKSLEKVLKSFWETFNDC